jgi:hypothetical protein
MAGGGGSGESTRARGERLGWVYMGAEGRLGGRGVNHVAGARAAWAARRCDVRRGGGQWRAAVGHLTPSKRSRSSPTVAFRRGAWTAGSAGASACARDARTAAGVACVRDIARGRALAFLGKNSLLRVFSK